MDNKKLKDLDIRKNTITDDGAEAMATALATNKSLVKLWIYKNPISGEAMVTVLQALGDDNTLQELVIPSYPSTIKDRISSIVQEINTKRRSQGIQEKLTVSYG